MKPHPADLLVEFVMQHLPDSIAARKRLLTSALHTIPKTCEQRTVLRVMLNTCEQMENDQMHFLEQLGPRHTTKFDGAAENL